MEQRPITFNLLHKDELEYEIKIRGAKPAEGVPALRAQIRSLYKDLPSDELLFCEVDTKEEVQTIQYKLNDLEELIAQSSSKSGSLKSLNRIQSLAHHLFHRLSRLDCGDDHDLADCRDTLQERLNRILVKLDNIMHHFKSSLSQALPADSAKSDAMGQHVENVSSDSNSAIHKLNLRFNGKTCVKAFLQRLDELCLSRGVSDARLFNSAAELFTDEALCWYRGARLEVHSWSDLKSLLLNEYLPADYDHRLLQEVRARTQGVDEGIINYLSIMQNYFSRLSKPLSEEDKLSIVLFNIRPFYTAQLALNPVESWADLKRKCKLLECAKERSQHFVEPAKVTSQSLAPDLGYKNSFKSVPRVAVVQSNDSNFCVRCRLDGHSLKSCKAPFALVCYRCGAQGCTARTCSQCSQPSSRSKVKAEVPKNLKK